MCMLTDKSSQVGNFSPITCGSLPNEDQIVSLNSGGYSDLDSQYDLTLFKTFHGSQRDDYMDNGTDLEADNDNDNILLTESTANVEDTPHIRLPLLLSYVLFHSYCQCMAIPKMCCYV